MVYPDHIVLGVFGEVRLLVGDGQLWEDKRYQTLARGDRSWRRGWTHKVRVTSVLDAHDTDTVELSGSGTEVDVGALVVVDRGLGPGMISQETGRRYQLTITV
jgi:hypothetical protein